jgi:methionine sulfoxide reductase heme-binding subunit
MSGIRVAGGLGSTRGTSTDPRPQDDPGAPNATGLLKPVLTARKTTLPTLPRFATMSLHRSISLLAVIFLAVHVGTAVADPYAQVRLVDTVVPFLGSWQALMLGLGTLALDAFAAVIVSSLLMRHVSRRVWRTIHWFGYGTWPLAIVHSLGIGSDSGALWLRALAVAMLASVGAAVVWRAPLPRPTARVDQRELARRSNTLSSAARNPTARAPLSTAASPRLETSRRGG